MELLFLSALRIERNKDFVEAAFEYLLVCSEASLDLGENMKLIEAGLLSVNEETKLEFAKFFFIESLLFTDDGLIRLQLRSFVDLSRWPLSVTLTVSGERSDVSFVADNVKVMTASNVIEFPVNKTLSGLFKFSSLSLSAGKFSWFILAAELERTFEVSSDSNHDISICCGVASECKNDS